MILDLLLISSIVMMIFESGFWEEMDEWIGTKLRFHHLPKIFVCQFCQCFWVSLIYLLFVNGFSLLTPFLALINANIGEIMLPLFKLIKNAFMRVLEWMIDRVI